MKKGDFVMRHKFFNLTCPQKAILNMEQFYPNTSMNTISGMVTIRDKVDFSLLRKAIHLFVKSTNNIRYQIHLEKDCIKQYEQEYESFNIKHFKLNSENKEKIYNFISRKCFTLYDSPLYYFSTFENEEDSTGGFFICVHHIISDAWSMGMLVSSVISIYSKLIKKEHLSIDYNNSFPYSSFIDEDFVYLNSPKFKYDEAFWDNLFEENIFEDLEAHTTASHLDFEASRIEFKLSKKMTSKIVSFCKQVKVSPFTFMLFIMAIYESKVKQSNHIVMSTPILNRSGQKDKNTFGLFVNNILYKLAIEDSVSFQDAINSLAKSQFSYLRHQKYPFQDLIAHIKEKFQIKENIYDTAVSYQNARTIHTECNVNYDCEWFFSGYSAIALLFHIYDLDNTDCFSFIYDYQNKVYEPSQIKDMHNRLLHICAQVIQNPNILIKDIELATQEEKHIILNNFNQTKVYYDSKKTILDLWEKQVSKHPDKTALICNNKEFSFKTLDDLSTQLATYLQKKYHIKSGHNISVILDRSASLVVAILSIIKCGCTYVLIDPLHPEDRQKYMIENSNSEYIISNLDLDIKNKINWDLSCTLKTRAKYQRPRILSKSSMYLLYTSGSTGMPKAVTITHRNFYNYLIGISQIIDYSREKSVLSMASVSFDVFGYELWVTLLNGLTLILSTNEEQNDFSKLNDLITRYNINILYGTPSKIQSLISSASDKHSFSSVTDIGIGGESFSLSFIKDLQKLTVANIYNMYGPTEATVGCCCKKLDKNTKFITIGKPLSNVRFYVLDKNLKLCPPGIKGELYICGDGVSNGYYNNPDLTAKSFIKDIFHPKLTMYKSGDMVSWTHQGELVFYGRNDSQVKVRGYRIELNEIERTLNTHPFIKGCTIINYNYNDRDLLCAYYISDFTIQSYELKLFLTNKLPSYMIPSHFIPITDLPLTINGKIDKSKLPSPFNFYKNEKYVKPENDLQKNICKALEKCLYIKKLSIDEDFSNLGMDSLSIIKIQSQLSNLGISIPTRYFYDYSTVKDLCFALEQISSSKDSSFINDNYSFLKHNLDKLKTKKRHFKNVLLTGCTGFLGVHILEALLNNTTAKIFCLVRASNIENAKNRISNIFKFYFQDMYTDDFLFDRIEVFVGDIRYKNLGLSEDTLDKIGNTIDCVIHSAALVKHIGKYDEFKKINLDGSKNVANFCIKYNIFLNHISTTSISCDFMPLSNTSDCVDFTEENFFIGQNYQENYYIKSKLLAEDYLLQNIKQGLLKANIFRVGNLTGRYRDGFFQYNIDSNAFYNKLQFILKNKFFYESSILQEFDLSPVDDIANAITTIIYNYGCQNKIFHMMNPRKIYYANFN